jgi:hypothetical protein
MSEAFATLGDIMWIKLFPLLFILMLLLPEHGFGQEEMASRYYRYRSTEMSTGIYEEYEARPRNIQGRVEHRCSGPGHQQGL